jgi:hypothetical protein
MVKKTTAEFIAQCSLKHNDKYDYSLVEYNGVGNKISIMCPEHGIFEKIARDHTNGQGCPSCSKIEKYSSYKLPIKDLINSFVTKHGDKYDYSLVDYVNLKIKIKIICPIHGEFEQRPSVHLRGEGCKKCYFKNKIDSLNLGDVFILNANTKFNFNYDYSLVNYQKHNIVVDIICPKHGVFSQRPDVHLRGVGCIYCHKENKLISDKITFINESKKLNNDIYDYSLVEYINATEKVKIICSEHGEFEQTPNNHLSKKNKCPKCALKYNLSQESVDTFLKTLNIETELNNRVILNGKELDIYIPSHKIAIEYNGLYWHSEEYISSNYHLIKTIECEKQGIQLIHLFEDEWLHKQDIVKSRLMNLLGLTSDKIYGRKTEVKEVSSKDSKEFLITNHIQGSVNSKIKLGLYHDNELVSLMTFGGLRKSMGVVGIDNQYELLRFCNKLNTSVIGGADKLLKHFVKIYNPIEIISYADRRWSQGGLYEKLGFTFTHDSKPNYWYVIGSNREYRFKYRKDVLVREGYDQSKTEHQIMLDRGINRIYDCGNKKYTLLFT